MKRRQSTLGFTLIEMLVVFTLLALLLTIAVPRYFHAVEGSREKVRLQNMATLRDALDKYRADQGRYPNDLIELVNKQYLRMIPLDPVSDTSAWIPLAHPAGLETGIYDVAPPKSPDHLTGEAPKIESSAPDTTQPLSGGVSLQK